MVEEQKEMSLNSKGLVTQNGPQSQEAATTTKLYLLALPRWLSETQECKYYTHKENIPGKWGDVDRVCFSCQLTLFLDPKYF